MPVRRYDPRYIHPDFVHGDDVLRSNFIHFYKPGRSEHDYRAVTIRSTVTKDVHILCTGREYWNETERYRLDEIYKTDEGTVHVKVTLNGEQRTMLIGLFLTKLIKSSFPVYAKSVIPWGM